MSPGLKRQYQLVSLSWICGVFVDEWVCESRQVDVKLTEQPAGREDPLLKRLSSSTVTLQLSSCFLCPGRGGPPTERT